MCRVYGADGSATEERRLTYRNLERAIMSSFPCLRDKHLFSDCPKRILSIDGGGIRGVIALAFLEETEALLAKRSGRGKDFRLCHYFDLIGGTSTGAIIATVLSLGYRVTDIVVFLPQKAFRGRAGMVAFSCRSSGPNR